MKLEFLKAWGFGSRPCEQLLLLRTHRDRLTAVFNKVPGLHDLMAFSILKCTFWGANASKDMAYALAMPAQNGGDEISDKAAGRIFHLLSHLEANPALANDPRLIESLKDYRDALLPILPAHCGCLQNGNSAKVFHVLSKYIDLVEQGKMQKETGSTDKSHRRHFIGNVDCVGSGKQRSGKTDSPRTMHDSKKFKNPFSATQETIQFRTKLPDPDGATALRVCENEILKKDSEYFVHLSELKDARPSVTMTAAHLKKMSMLEADLEKLQARHQNLSLAIKNAQAKPKILPGFMVY